MEPARILGVDADFAAKLKAARDAPDPLPDRQARPASGMVEGFRGEDARASGTCRTCIRSIPGSEFTSRRNAEFWRGSARFARTAAGCGRRVYRLEPRMGHQLLGASAGWREGLGIGLHAAAAQHRAESVRHASGRQFLDLSDRRQFRRHGGHRGNAAAEPRWRNRLSAGAARAHGRGERRRIAGARRC